MGLRLSYADFFPGERLSEADEPLLSLPSQNFLLYGPHAAGITTLLFHYAFSCASAGHCVTVIAPRGALERRPPNLLNEAMLNSPHWSLINLKYFDTASQVVKYASLLHMTTVTQPSTPPHVLLVYDLERLCYAELASPGSSTPPDATLCRILAVLTDSMEFIARATGRSTLMAFFLPITHSAEAPKPLHILLRWLPLALRCHNFSMNAGASHEASHEESECHGQDTYRLEVSYAQSAEHQSTQQIQAITQEKVPRLSVLYSMDKGLVLKDILRNDE